MYPIVTKEVLGLVYDAWQSLAVLIGVVRERNIVTKASVILVNGRDIDSVISQGSDLELTQCGSGSDLTIHVSDEIGVTCCLDCGYSGIGVRVSGISIY